MKLQKNQATPLYPENDLFEAIASIRTTEEAKLFFQDLCTPTEIQAMADRWIVVPSIKDNKPYRQIHDETGVSVTTIGRVARCLMLGKGGYNLIFARLKRKTQKK
jgi:TrpR-related protein YerC/YecD